jgi:hypothetical protein
MRTTTVLLVLLVLSSASTSCQHTVDAARPAAADAPKPSAQAPAATQPAGPDAILGFTLDFPPPAPVGTGSDPVPPAAFSLAESPISHPEKAWNQAPQTTVIELPSS